MKKIQLLFIFLIAFSSVKSQSQQLSDKATVSIVTCGPGNELYTAFGHSAFRVFDPVLGMDKIYNYGTFDFNAPNFYFNFAKGNLIYQLSTTTFSRFLRAYQYENRWVKLQQLDLDIAQVQQIFDYLENNAKPENKEYRYDFFYDNCSTKIEEVVKNVLKDAISFSNNHITTTKTHRDLINDYARNFKWGKFGIDLALGSVIDDEATPDEYKFLPDYIYQAFNNATLTKNSVVKPIVKKEVSILNEQQKTKSFELFTPFNVLLLLSICIILITLKNHKQSKQSKWLDFLIFFTTGIIGIVVLLLWFATTHTATYKNFNFLWAFAPNLVIAFLILKKKTPHWIKKYLQLLLVSIGVLFMLWAFKIQVFNYALVPFICALIIRYRYLLRIFN